MGVPACDQEHSHRSPLWEGVFSQNHSEDQGEDKSEDQTEGPE